MIAAIVFLITLGLIVAMLVMKMREVTRDKPSVTLALISRGDSFFVRQFQSLWNFSKTRQKQIQDFIIHHLPEHSDVIYSKLKHFRDINRRWLARNFRGKQDLTRKGASSLFLWHISSDEGSEKKGKK